MKAEIFAPLLLSALLGVGCDGGFSVVGTVRTLDRVPIEGAEVTFYGDKDQPRTKSISDTNGEFTGGFVSGPSKKYRGHIVVSKVGYKTIRVPYTANNRNRSANPIEVTLVPEEQ